MENCWNEQNASNLDDLDLLVYQSQLIGNNSDLVLTGGGNTAIKTVQKDFRDLDTSVLFVKTSGADLKTAGRDAFVGLRLDELKPLVSHPDMLDHEMVDYLMHCMLNPTTDRPSIETLIHAFIPMKSTVHSHPDAIVSLTNTKNHQEILSSIYGHRVPYINYLLPGFSLSKIVHATIVSNPEAHGIILINHGLFSWGETPKQAYDRHIEITNLAEKHITRALVGKKIFNIKSNPSLEESEIKTQAAILTPSIRKLISSENSMVLTFDIDPDCLAFINSEEGSNLSQIGPATPDHTLHTKIKPLWVTLTNISNQSLSSKEISEAIKNYRWDYTKWYEAHTDHTQPILDANPRVILVPGLGMWSTGKDIRAALIAQDVYRHTIKVIKSATALDEYVSLSEASAYQVEYWPMELHKLTLAGKSGPFSSKIVLITGAAHGIGRAVAQSFASSGAHVFLTDIDAKGINSLASQINETHGYGKAFPFVMDVTDEAQVAAAFERLCLTYGGLDILVSNAGIAAPGPIDELDLLDWNKAFSVNATGHFLVAKKAIQIMKTQELGGNIVFIGTRNVPSPGAEFGAYSSSKAAEVQLAKVLALENAVHGIRVNIVNPDAVFEGSNLWSADVRKQRSKAHGVDIHQLEDFYIQRNLLKAKITGDDVARAVLFLASDDSSKTTGTMLPVDGGIKDAFLR
jgi:rhamnulose-1-phosphate aldolase/alcohol dehydrogenase